MQAMIKGVPIKIYCKTQTGIDEFGRPTYTQEAVTVDNVLIGEPSADDIVNELNLSGKRAVYTIAIPKGDTHDWTNAVVEFFGTKYRTIGAPTMGIEDNIPLSWNKMVKVECYG